MLGSLQRRWPEHLIEAAGLGAFMLSAGVFASLLEHPASPLRADAAPWWSTIQTGTPSASQGTDNRTAPSPAPRQGRR